jgi:hypothetical protein
VRGSATLASSCRGVSVSSDRTDHPRAKWLGEISPAVAIEIIRGEHHRGGAILPFSRATTVGNRRLFSL